MGAFDVGRGNEGPSESGRVTYVVRDREGRVVSEVRHDPLGTTTYYYYYDVDSEVCLGWSGELPFRSADSDVTRVVLTDEEGSPIAECRPVPEEVAHQIILRDDSLGEPPRLAQTQDGVWHRCEWMDQLTPGERVIVRFWSDDNLVDLQTVVVDDGR